MDSIILLKMCEKRSKCKKEVDFYGIVDVK